ncbi:aspartate/glutamate racemase family protein [Gluconobacter wancherniae]|uniref:aspartate/glutamate racemase family protein n=1 Tax=Gluconobacter wancherniae TaxID=1307955 RepID=UPI0020115BC7|nr:aspartate/glutamate racemase family protein [Gluconobacter wancherniae]
MIQRIVLLHATPVAVEPIQDAFRRLWPEAEIVNLLDDGLTIDRNKSTELSQELTDRFVRLGQYGAAMETDGLLITCSAFGPAIDVLESALTIPVLRPNEAMFRAALENGKRIGMLATFAPAVVTMEAEFATFRSYAGSDAVLETIIVPDAIEALRRGDAETHNRLVGEYASQLKHCDVIMLAHFSTSRARAAVEAAVNVPVLAAPDAAVLRMRALVNA